MQTERLSFQIISLVDLSQLQSLSLWNAVKERCFLPRLQGTLSALLSRSLKTFGFKRNELNTKAIPINSQGEEETFEKGLRPVSKRSPVADLLGFEKVRICWTLLVRVSSFSNGVTGGEKRSQPPARGAAGALAVRAFCFESKTWSFPSHLASIRSKCPS
jgi:hypothetical protein